MWLWWVFSSLLLVPIAYLAIGALRNWWLLRGWKDHDSVWLLRSWSKPLLMVEDAALVRQVLSDEKRLQRSIPGLEAERRFGVQVFTAYNGAEHSLHRRVVHGSMRQEFSPMLARMVEKRSCDLIAALSEESPAACFPFLVSFVSASIAEFVYGSTGAERSRSKEAIPHIARMASFLAPVWLQNLLESLPTPMRRVREARELDVLLSSRALSEFRREEDEPKDRETLFYLLYRSNSSGALSDRDLIANASIFAAGGTDSTASVLCSAFFILSQNPEMQTQMADDEYLTLFIKEVLRLYPPFPIIGYRYAQNEEYQLGKTISVPAGLCMSVNLLSLQRDERFWGPDAKKFRPERWLESTRPEADQLLYFPWGAGARMCVGKPLALAMLRAFLPAVCRRFRLTATQEFSAVQPCANAMAGVTSPPKPLTIRFEPV